MKCLIHPPTIARRCFALAALAAVLWLALGHGPATAQDVERGGPKLPETPEVVTSPVPGATPTIDRLAPPPTVVAPTQADEGAQLYWLHCQPCHGDQGQGLTDEWRAQYPPQEQYCWESGCHGERPYENGFTLPFTIPAVIGDGTLTKYQSVGGLYRYVQTAMPFWNPASLTEEEYLAITAYLARAHGAWNGTMLTVGNVDSMPFPAGLSSPAGATAPLPATATPIPTPTTASGNGILLWGGLALGVMALAGGLWLWQRLNR